MDLSDNYKQPFTMAEEITNFAIGIVERTDCRTG